LRTGVRANGFLRARTERKRNCHAHGDGHTNRDKHSISHSNRNPIPTRNGYCDRASHRDSYGNGCRDRHGGTNPGALFNGEVS
jgi:hypothetical protein